jgi:Ca2+-binding RTX toxin-like protein
MSMFDGAICVDSFGQVEGSDGPHYWLAAAPNPKPSFTRAEAAAQITRYNLKWYADLDGITRVTYGFAAESPVLAGRFNTQLSFSRFDETQINFATQLLNALSDVANIKFDRVGTGVSGETAYTNSATILFSNYYDDYYGFFGFGEFPGDSDPRSNTGNVYLNKFTIDDNSMKYLSGYSHDFLHEVGHAIGLSHPGDYKNGLYDDSAEYIEDSNQYTIMSYFGSQFTGASFGLYSSTPLIDDIGALQRLYGANMTTRTGDTVYGFNSTADRDWFAASKDGIARPVIFCVWDAGGNDTLDFSGYSDIQLIDLNAERFSNVGGYIGNVSIATNVVIENAIGGSGDDSLIGNSADNRLEGRAGNDSLSGGAGNDTLVGGVGDDRLDGGAGLDIASYAEVKSDLTLDLTLSTAQSMGSAGRDTLISIEGIIGGSGNDSLKGGAEDNYFEGGAGNDRLDGGDGLDVASFAGLTRTLDIDLSTFSGTITTDLGTDTLISIEGIVGGAANDSLKGDGGANYLDGGAGDDSLVGRGGDDLYVVDSGNDKVIETANEGTDLVKALISYGLAANVENLTLLGNAAIDGTGNSLDNILTGNGAANRLDGGAGNDRLIGGGGDDVYLLDSSGDVVVENANEGADTILAGFSYSLGTNLENLTLTGTGAIDGTGNGLDNLLTGNSGNNQLFGGAGNDILIGGAGNDRLDGGDGFDLASYDDLTIALEVDLNNSAGTVISASGTDTLVSIEGIVGGSGNDTLKGNGADNQLGGGSGDDTLMGLAGNDILRGGAGLDQIDGGAGDDTLYGEAGNDNLSGDAGDDVIDGGVGDDVLSGGDGVDKLVGGVGNDRLLGGAGSDTLQGGDGNDTLSGDDGNDLLSGGAGADTMDGGSGNNELYGGDGNDILRAGDVGDRIYGDAGDDTITGGAGFDQLYGGSGNDTINGGAGTDLLFGGAGDDILNGGEGFDYVRYSYSYQNLTVDLRIKAAQDTGEGFDKLISIEGIQGGSGDDMLIGDDSRNEINGGWGNDKLYGYDGYDALQGDLGDDILNGGAGNDTLDGGAGLDLASYAEVTTDLNFDLNLKTPQKMGSAGSDTLISIEGIIGGSGNDSLTGNGDNNVFEGGAGNDRLDGGAGLDVASFAGLTTGIEIDLSAFSGTITTALGTDTLISIEGLIGGSGNDVLKAGATATYLEGGAGNDFLGGSAYADTLIGGAGDDGIAAGADNDSLDGGAGDDTLLGQAGDDIIGGGAGRDFIDGGDGSDRLNGGEGNDWFNGGNGDDIINADAGNDSVYGDAGNDTIDGAHGNDEIYGGDGNDTVTGGLGDDRISGGVGNDLLYGGDGNDTISGNDGDDRIIGGDGDDNLYGFTGYDQIIGGNGNDTLLGMEGDDTLDGQLGNDYLVGGSGNDQLYGGDGNDSMDGGDGNDVLNGETGDDSLTGGAGDDALFGGAGNDQLWAGDGNDGLDGNDGNDLIIGGMGQDTLAGGAGADAFFFMAANESTAAARDRITDFNWADGDYIDLSRIDANTTVAGDQAFSFVNSFSKQAGQATLTYDAASNTSTFSADVDGDGIADFVLQVNGQQNTGQGWVL